MSISVFLSHNHNDKPFVRKLARDLENHGVRYWLDEAEMKIGDSLIQKIREGIDSVDYFAVVLSPDSINAPWVVNELDVAMNHQIKGKKIKVLPIMLKECDPPGFLVGKLYADFRDQDNYVEAFKRLIQSIGIVFNKNVLRYEKTFNNLGTALDKASYANIPIMCKPFHRPFQYMGMQLSQAENIFECKGNEVGSIIIEDEDCRMYLEAEGNFISYIEVDFKKTAPHYQNQEFDSELFLGALSIGLSELDLVGKKTHIHAYYDHRRKLKITVSCLYDEAPITVSFSSKYYGM
ncbi:toll/interleukin-1 receptor domain-containing protein [Citrobacter braakii]|uniref:toll/interleukin-1 receptor domain-containing protein n=1 Tax=Citrobacter braakii TaxID=57706 RepID=UPI0022824D28|nr:toll/interleukin-1 receptor domain-containing protein [Citrobacter braakii]MCY9798272.1 toll/interleukin-1 receptor domain-containing protein [Citrobacter braakii]